ncbi:unnamed protein product [Candidula unifasciata]|uniref:RING-type domain-containing protein n=1 Tax=Candidula unifasciata TaxID=100452 RepID=A0A8S3YX66_9EUPU|nr:unnamed protein product [Candidula unifasciata]
MSIVKKMLVVIGRLPLLFVVNSVLKGTLTDLADFPVDSLSPVYSSLILSRDSVSSAQDNDTLVTLLWFLFLFTVAVTSLILVCSPIGSLLEVYGCCLGFGLLVFSYCCNYQFVHGNLFDTMFQQRKVDARNVSGQHLHSALTHRLRLSSVIINMLTQFFILLAFDQICIVGTLCRSPSFTRHSRYRLDIILFMSFTLPILLHSVVAKDSIIYDLSPTLALLFPLLLLIIHSGFVLFTIFSVVFREVRNIRNNFRDVGIDGLLVRLMEKANLSWLLRTFFLTKVIYQVMMSKVLSDAEDFSSLNWEEMLDTAKLLLFEVLHSMCDTILSVMSMASIVSTICGFVLKTVYRIIGAQDEEESIQPAVSGFLFVLLAMQTGITSIASEGRLQLLFQNCILLVVANQHFVQTVAADLVLKASTDDIAIVKHIRPMLPYVIFFSFPFLVLVRLWEYPFRLSWLLAISAFSLELIIKSLGTLTFYALNMLQSRTNFLHENIDDCSFYIKATCGCLEFACGIFLFCNGAYIFFFESGGVIRFVMMVIHFYCNIYQTAVKGLKAYRLRQSAWEKMNRLQSASQEQLDENDDICPICYQEMVEAVVVKCSHVFHRGCLQKWLTIQEKCPLCHVDLSEEGQPNKKNN